MFERMSQVASTYATTTTIQKADVTDLVELRQRLSRSWGQEAKPRYIAFFVKSASMALSEFPILNATLDSEAQAVRLNRGVNIGIAVNTDRGLLVPVLHGVAELSLKELATAMNELVSRAVDNKLGREDFRGGTFTITNAGPLGAYLNTPMINPPQSAILGTCSIDEEPAVMDGQIVIRKLMFLSLSYDHRIIEGSEAVGFLKRVKQLLEDPSLLLGE
jgi:pyruvate/2-oxoglutarate dehydrogenase complex dihydrolipoamide acyltransferase (E2) component